MYVIVVITEPTRVTVNSSTLIDPVIVSAACAVLDSVTMDVDVFVSAHKATYISIQININLKNSCYRAVWNYKNGNFERLNHLIRPYNWDSRIYDDCTIDQACKSFTDLFLKILYQMYPSQKNPNKTK